MSVQAYGLAENVIPYQDTESSFGQLFMSTPESRGTLEMIEEFKGKKINGISGGHKKIFLFQEVDESENIVTALHPESQDFIEYKQQRNLSIDELITSIQGLRIIEIISGKTHNIIRTEEGKIFSFGKGEFGCLGLGGCVFTAKPRLISKLDNKKIVSVACGAFHTLALSQIGDLFSWGRGFEGQLGLLETTETVSSPQFVPHFFKYDHHKDAKMLRKVPIHKIACGSYHSLAIDHTGTLYSWGQALYGQTGSGRKKKQPKPFKIDIQLDGEIRKIEKVAGGYGHTLCLTQQGQIFGWGLNIKGQVGINDLREGMESNQDKLNYCKAVMTPTHLKYSRDSDPLPKFIDISCGFSRSFGIDASGSIWAWGGGCLGFKERYSERGPTKLTQGTQNKRFSKVYANEDSLVAFAKLSPTYFKPTLAPSRGGTQMTFFGTGFTDTGLQSAVFNLGTYSEHVELSYDPKTSTYFCLVPNFDAQKRNLDYPLECEISLTLDGHEYHHFERKLLIYSERLAMEHIQPKSASALGDTQARIYMPLHNLIQDYCESITVGFKSNSKADGQNKMQDWVCVEGVYKENKIICKLPNLPFFDNNDPFYVVDVSFNGQQFTNHPQTMRFYLITQANLSPIETQDQEQPEITITANGLFDTPFRKLTLHLDFTSQGKQYSCLKNVEALWHKADKKFTFKMPTLQWILGDINITEKLLEDARLSFVIVRLNLSQHDPIQMGRIKFNIPPPPVQPQEETNKKDSKKDGKKGGKK